MRRQFLKIIFPIPEYVQTHCNDKRNPFRFACRKWYLYNLPQRWYSIITPIQLQRIT